MAITPNEMLFKNFHETSVLAARIYQVLSAYHSDNPNKKELVERVQSILQLIIHPSNQLKDDLEKISQAPKFSTLCNNFRLETPYLFELADQYKNLNYSFSGARAPLRNVLINFASYLPVPQTLKEVVRKVTDDNSTPILREIDGLLEPFKKEYADKKTVTKTAATPAPITAASSSSSSNSTPEKPNANFIPSFNIQPSEKIQKETLDLKIEQEVCKQKPSDPIDLLIEKILQNKLIIGLSMQPKIDQKLKRNDKKATEQLISHFNQLKAEDRIETQLKSLHKDYDPKTGLQRINEQVSPNPGFYLKTDKVAADPHILDKWLNSRNNSNSKSIVESFEANLAGGLEFKRALAKLIKISFETGDFTVGNKEQFKQFLLNNSEIFNFLQKNIDNLNKPNEDLKEYISDKKIKILPKQVPITEQDKKHAQEDLESARKMLEENIGRRFDVQQSTSPKGKSPRK